MEKKQLPLTRQYQYTRLHIVLIQKPKIYIFLENFKFLSPNLLARHGAVSFYSNTAFNGINFGAGNSKTDGKDLQTQ